MLGRTLTRVPQILSPLVILLAAAIGSAVAADLSSAPSESIGNLKDLMALFESSGGVRAEFSEKRYLSILEEPIETRGVLYFSPPDRLARYTNYPDQSSMVANGELIILRDRTGEQTMTLGSSELARQLVDSFAVLLRGDLKALTGMYRVELHFQQGQGAPQARPWTLDLEPRSPRIRKLIERIRVEGLGNKLIAKETLETNGDRSIMVFPVVQTGLNFGDEEIELFFLLKNRDSAP